MTDARINEMLADLEATCERLEAYRNEIVYDETLQSRGADAFCAIEAVGKLEVAKEVVTSAAINLLVAYNASYKMRWQRGESEVKTDERGND